MRKKNIQANFRQIIDSLAAQSFDVAEAPGVAEGKLVIKHGAAAVLVPGQENSLAFAVTPGLFFGGKICRLLDRGFQKFFTNGDFEFPATADQLHAIHQFTEELKNLAGAVSLYNESMGSSSDRYHYDRPTRRTVAESIPTAPWESASAH